ncbi:MAG: hypothetical protein ACLQGP_03230 [Isosphaeraceae bacterium]
MTDDVEYLIKSVAPEGNQTAQTVLAVLNQFKSGEMVKGLDRGHGFGLAITLPKDFPQGDPPSIVAAIPVTDLGQFLDSLKGLGLAVDDQPGAAGFSHRVTAPNGNPSLFVLQSKGYAIFSMTPDGVDRLKKLDPSSWKPKGRPETAISVKVKLSEIPDALKEQFLGQVEASVDQQNDRKPGEDDAQYRGRIAGQKTILEALKSLIRDGDEIALDVDLDRKVSELDLEIGITANPNTSMARSLKSLTGRRSRFESMSEDASIAAWATLPVPKELRDVLSGLLDKAMKDNLKKAKTDEEKTFATRLGEHLKTALAAPDIDLGMAIHAPSATKKSVSHLVLLGGMSVPNAQDFLGLVRDSAGKVKLGDNVKMTFDVAKAADGTAIHQLSGPTVANDAGMKKFGNASLFFAVRQGTFLYSFGEDGLEPLRQAIEKSKEALAAGPAQPIAIAIRLTGLVDFAEKNDEEAFRRAISEVFPGDGAKRDRFVFGVKGDGNGVQVRLSIDVPALKFLGMIGSRTQH